MVQGKKKLTAAQQVKLDYVREVDQSWRLAKEHARIEAMREADRKIEQHAAVRDRAVLEAVLAGVPKASVGRDGLNTSNPNTVYDILKRAMATGDVAIPSAPVIVEKYRWGVLRFAKKDTIYIHLLVDGRNDRTGLASHPEGDGLLMHFDLEYENKSLVKGIDQYKDAELYQDVRAWAMEHRDELVKRIKAGEILACLDGVTPDAEQYWVSESEEEEVEWLG